VAVTGQGRPLSVSAIPITPGTLSSGKDARCRDDWTFDFAGLLGREVFRIVKAPAGWTLGAIKLEGLRRESCSRTRRRRRGEGDRYTTANATAR
jgi:hypothetical protein